MFYLCKSFPRDCHKKSNQTTNKEPHQRLYQRPARLRPIYHHSWRAQPHIFDVLLGFGQGSLVRIGRQLRIQLLLLSDIPFQPAEAQVALPGECTEFLLLLTGEYGEFEAALFFELGQCEFPLSR